MPFPKFEMSRYPIRQWAAFGFPNTGKSAFLSVLKGPLLVVDADQRFDATLRKNLQLGRAIEAHRLSENREDNTNPLRIVEILDANMPGAKIGTIAVDSLTTIIAPRVTRGIVAKKENDENLIEAWKDKATTMRLLQDGCTKWGVCTFWIWHLNEARDAQAKAQVNETLSRSERTRIMRSLNMRLEFIRERDKYGVKVVWARDGRSGMTLWDEPGNFWQGMPERIEHEVYDGLTAEDRKRLEHEPPELFPDEATAIAWGLEHGPFHALEHARNAWDLLKREAGYDNLGPVEMPEMTALWVADIDRRNAEVEEMKKQNGQSGKPAEPASTEELVIDTSTKFWTWVNQQKIAREHATKALADTHQNYQEAYRKLRTLVQQTPLFGH